MSYKFDGKYFKHNGRTLATISGDSIKNGTGGITLATVRGDQIKKGTGGSTLLTIRGRDVREGTGGSKLIALDQVDKLIDGPGGATKAALWYLFIK